MGVTFTVSCYAQENGWCYLLQGVWTWHSDGMPLTSRQQPNTSDS